LNGSELINEEDSIYSYTFRSKDIPNGTYEVSIVATDVLGNTTEQLYNIDTPLGEKNASGEYPFMTSFKIDYKNIGNTNIDSI
jgi:hypothetical protein